LTYACTDLNNGAPTFETPPPITIFSGSNVLMIDTQATPSTRRTLSIKSTIFESPAAYKSNISFVVKYSFIIADPRFAMAVPETIDSRHPYCPQAHCPNDGSTTVCPISPALPFRPRSSFPSATIPDPTPVLTVI